MSFYEELVIETQRRNYSRYYSVYARGGTPFQLTDKPSLPYDEQIAAFAREVASADAVLVGGASGLSAAGGGDFYYADTASFRAHFGKFAEKYHFVGAFNGIRAPFQSRAEFWGYLATFLHTTQTAPLRAPYKDLDAILAGKDFHILTTNQDTQFVKLYPESKVSEIQGDHRFFQCSRCCTDETWDAVVPVREMIASMGEGTEIDPDLIPRCPHCGAEAFPWVRGYGNFLEGSKYEAEYQKTSDYIEAHADERLLFIELGVGRLTPMFIQEPFWQLTANLPQARYISVNDKYDFLPQGIEDKGMSIVGDIAAVLSDVRAEVEGGARR